MASARTRLAIGAWLALTAAAAGPAAAVVIEVPASAGALALAAAAAAPGDTLLLAAGVHGGGLVIDTPMILSGVPGASIDGGGAGSVITVAAPDVTITGLRIVNSGTDMFEMDAGIRVAETAARARIEGNVLDGNLFGVVLQGPADARVLDNDVTGRRDVRVNDRGNGVQIWRSPGSVVAGNSFRHGRDGIYVTNSRGNRFADNRFTDLRFAIHYMYTHDSVVVGNLSVGNHVGYALMFSEGLTVTDNVSRGDRDQGLQFNYTNDTLVAGNTIIEAGEKCLFLYNSHRNRVIGNWLEGCGLGLHYTAGSQDNLIHDNAFVANRGQVLYVGSRWQDWSHDGRGNFWSSHPAVDLDGDGLGDTAYRPNGLADELLYRYPAAALLTTSPAIRTLRWAHSNFPALYPGGVIDSAPLMRPSIAPAPSGDDVGRDDRS